MAQIEGGHADDRVGAVPGPDSVNRHVTGPGWLGAWSGSLEVGDV